MRICKRVHYTGTVQGVGFRYTARELAAGVGVAGFVRNLSDGRVELVAEGEVDQVKRLLDAIAGQMRGYIEDAVVSDDTPSGATDFRIRV
jgi:acylphosphatase